MYFFFKLDYVIVHYLLSFFKLNLYIITSFSIAFYIFFYEISLILLKSRVVNLDLSLLGVWWNRQSRIQRSCSRTWMLTGSELSSTGIKYLQYFFLLEFIILGIIMSLKKQVLFKWCLLSFDKWINVVGC